MRHYVSIHLGKYFSFN